MTRLVPVAFQPQVTGGILLAAGVAACLAVVADEPRAVAVAAILLASAGIYFAVVWRLRLRDGIADALGRAEPAPPDARLEPAWRTALRGTGLALLVCAVALGLGLLHLAAVGTAILLGAGAATLLRASQIRAWERTHRQRVLRAPGADGYLLRERTIDTSLPLV